jgi:hypothetical protein
LLKMAKSNSSEKSTRWVLPEWDIASSNDNTNTSLTYDIRTSSHCYFLSSANE